MKSKLRILFLHEVNYLDKPIFEMHEFPELLATKGHHVGFSHFPEGWDSKTISRHGWKKKIVGRSNPKARLFLYTPQIKLTNFLGRLYFSVISIWECLRTLEDFKPDIVVSYSLPTSGWQMLLACRLRRIPFVFRAIDVSHKIRRTKFSLLIRAAESFVYRFSSSVSANNAALKNYVLDHGGKRDSTMVHLPPLDLDNFRFSITPPTEIRQKLKIEPDGKIILYMGTFFYFSGLDEVLQHLANFKSENWVLVLIGGGEERINLEYLVHLLGLESRVKFTGYVDFESLSSYLKIADIAINPMKILPVSSLALPNKVLQYLASGVRVVSTRLLGLESLFSEPQVTFVDSPRKVVEKALQILRDGREPVSVDTECAVIDFDKVIAVGKFESYLSSMVS